MGQANLLVWRGFCGFGLDSVFGGLPAMAILRDDERGHKQRQRQNAGILHFVQDDNLKARDSNSRSLRDDK
jgi:hypothetical protein